MKKLITAVAILISAFTYAQHEGSVTYVMTMEGLPPEQAAMMNRERDDMRQASRIRRVMPMSVARALWLVPYLMIAAAAPAWSQEPNGPPPMERYVAGAAGAAFAVDTVPAFAGEYGEVVSRSFLAYANYSYVNATFQSVLLLSSPNNPAADPATRTILVTPGDHIPAIPRHRFNGRNPEPRPWRFYLLFARDQRHRIHPGAIGDLVVDLARQQTQRQTDHA